MSGTVFSASVVASVGALGLLEGDVLMTDPTEAEPLMLYRPLSGLPVAVIAKALLLAIASGCVRVQDAQFRADLEVLAGGHSPKIQSRESTKRPGLALV